jgi:ABC-type lipoprotein release transport system permease subunit
MMVARKSRSRAFMLELILDIVVFALCAVISLQVFIEARMVSAHSAALSHMSIEAQVIAETVKACDGKADAVVASLAVPDINLEEKTDQGTSRFALYYDKDFLRSSDSSLRYVLVCTIDTSRPVVVAHIEAYDKEDLLLNFDVKDYVPSAAPHEGGAS